MRQGLIVMNAQLSALCTPKTRKRADKQNKSVSAFASVKTIKLLPFLSFFFKFTKTIFKVFWYVKRKWLKIEISNSVDGKRAMPLFVFLERNQVDWCGGEKFECQGPMWQPLRFWNPSLFALTRVGNTIDPVIITKLVKQSKGCMLTMLKTNRWDDGLIWIGELWPDMSVHFPAMDGRPICLASPEIPAVSYSGRQFDGRVWAQLHSVTV